MRMGFNSYCFLSIVLHNIFENLLTELKQSLEFTITAMFHTFSGVIGEPVSS